MAKYLTIGYGDRIGYEMTPEELRSAAHEQDRKLRDGGALIGMAGAPVQVRNTLGKQVETKSGAFMSSELPIAGFAIIDADDISEAIQTVAQTPCAIAYGVVEVWPLEGTR
jgi:hypothetical protein